MAGERRGPGTPLGQGNCVQLNSWKLAAFDCALINSCNCNQRRLRREQSERAARLRIFMKLLPQLRSKWAEAAAATGHETQWLGNSQDDDVGDELAWTSTLTRSSSVWVSRSGANDFSATNKSIQARKQCQCRQRHGQAPPSSSVLVLLSAPSTLNRGDSSIKRTNGQARPQRRDRGSLASRSAINTWSVMKCVCVWRECECGLPSILTLSVLSTRLSYCQWNVLLYP